MAGLPAFGGLARIWRVYPPLAGSPTGSLGSIMDDLAVTDRGISYEPYGRDQQGAKSGNKIADVKIVGRLTVK